MRRAVAVSGCRMESPDHVRPVPSPLSSCRAGRPAPPAVAASSAVGVAEGPHQWADGTAVRPRGRPGYRPTDLGPMPPRRCPRRESSGGPIFPVRRSLGEGGRSAASPGCRTRGSNGGPAPSACHVVPEPQRTGGLPVRRSVDGSIVGWRCASSLHQRPEGGCGVGDGDGVNVVFCDCGRTRPPAQLRTSPAPPW